MFKFTRYLKFLWSATNQHGVHSPFVYAYVTKGLYSKTKYPYQKTTQVVLKSISYFNATHLGLPINKTIKKTILKYYPNVQFTESPFDILLLNASDEAKINGLLSEESKINNDSLLLIDGIYDDEQRINLWETVKNHKNVRVTVDLFYCGAVFFREEQVKEHFKIRI